MPKINHLGLIPYSTFPLFHGRAEHLLQAAIDHGRGEATLNDVLAELSDLRALAFGEVVDNALVSLVTVKVIAYPQMRVLHVAYGSGRSVGRLLPAIKAFCRDEGITRIETWCRESVARLYRKFGFDIGYCVPVLEI